MVVNHFATKDDLNDFRNEIKADFATKDDLKGVKNELKVDLLRLENKIEKKLESLGEKITEETNKVLNSNDKVIKKLDTFLTEKTVLGGRVDQSDKEVAGLKCRVANIEKHVGIESVPISI